MRLGMGISTVFGPEKEVLSGDQVWLLQGSNLPVILRQIPAEAKAAEDATPLPTDEHSHYAFVGTAYIHGIMDGEACPSADMFTDITHGQYPRSSKSPSPANESMRDALWMSLLLGHGSRKTNRNRPSYAPGSRVSNGEAQNEGEGAAAQGTDAEALLFPEGREWPASTKPIPQHRVFFSAMMKNPPATESEWQALVRDLARKSSAQRNRRAVSTIIDNQHPELSKT